MDQSHHCKNEENSFSQVCCFAEYNLYTRCAWWIHFDRFSHLTCRFEMFRPRLAGAIVDTRRITITCKIVGMVCNIQGPATSATCILVASTISTHEKRNERNVWKRLYIAVQLTLMTLITCVYVCIVICVTWMPDFFPRGGNAAVTATNNRAKPIRLLLFASACLRI